MNFSENINRICKDRGTSLSAVVQSLGLSTSKVSYWNNGSLPKAQILEMLAEVLDCSVAEFFKDENEIISDDLTEDEKDILRIYRQLSRRNQHEFMSMVYSFEEDIK